MTKKRLEQCKGPLSPIQITNGINAAITNSKRLVEDAETLFKEKRYPSATFLSILSIEESGKVSILRELALVDDPAEINELWKRYRSHTEKNIMWFLPILFSQGARKLEDFRPLFYPNAEHPFVIEMVKQISVYTDCLAKSHWSVPEDVIDEKMALSLLDVAKILLKDQEISPAEITLWIKYMKPVFKGPTNSAKKVLADWHKELVRRKLIDGDENDMTVFVGMFD